MKSNTEKITLQFLIKILYDEFDNLFLNIESFFIKTIIKFVIQQKLLNLCCVADNNKDFLKRLRIHNFLCVEKSNYERIFLNINILSDTDDDQY